MHLARPGVSHHAHYLPARRATHNGIVDQNHALPFEQMAYRIELQLHAKIANRLRRFDKGPPHIMITNQRLPVRYPRF